MEALRHQSGDQLRVVMYLHTGQRGGAELMALAELNYLNQRHLMFISAPEGPLLMDLPAGLARLAPAPLVPLWDDSAKRWIGAFVKGALAVPRLRRELRRNQIDVAVTSSATLVAPVIAARLAGVGVVVHVRDVAGSRFTPLVIRFLQAVADRTVIITPLIGGSKGPRTVLIRDGIALPPWVPRNRDMPSDLVRLAIVGALDPRKGQDVGVQALALLRKSGLSCQLTLFGRQQNDDFTAKLRQTIDSLGLTDGVVFAGVTDDIDSALADVDLILVPSRDEWTPLVAMEALARGVPVVASDVGAVSEIVLDGSTGLLVPPENPTALADAVVRLVSDDALRDKLVREGRRHVQEHFDIETSLARLDDEIRSVRR